jgi:hypothetical protein
MKTFARLFFLLVLIGFGFWAWTSLFPNPKNVVHNRLVKLARLASFSAQEGNIGRLANLHQLSLLFSGDAQVAVEISGNDPHVFNGREEVLNAAMAARSLVKTLKAEFLDINIEMGVNNQSALVDLTAKADVNGQRNSFVQEFKFTFRKIDGDWLITRVDPVTSLKL